jgi:predicted enzyme related to lactoylglutathione lyase/adenylylsulfate kinase-like enzyme
VYVALENGTGSRHLSLTDASRCRSMAGVSASRLLVISGPIGSGKSTAASLLAGRFRASGRSAANVDLDRLYLMLEDRLPMADPRLWGMARRAAAALVDQWARDGVELIVVEGTFWTESERAEFSECLSTPVQPLYVTLQVTVDEAQRRVVADAGRRLSKLHQVVRRCHADFAATRAIPSDLTIDSTATGVDEVVSILVAAIDAAADRSPDAGPGAQPLFGDIDCVQIPVADLDSALAFYRVALGQALLWRTDTAAGLQLSNSRAEIVVQTERSELEANLSVGSADSAAQRFVQAGGTLIVPPFDIQIGRCTVVQDPWGNRLVLLDHRYGRLVTDADRRVIPTSTEPPRDVF